jgi:adenosine deaminase
VSGVEDFVRDVPKAELHIHVEGSLEPEMMFRLAERNNVRLPYGSVEEIREAYRFENLQSFLNLYYAGTSVLLGEQDFYDLTWAYLQKVASQNVQHTEIFFDPQVHVGRGVDFATVHSGIYRAVQDAERLGVSAQLIMCFTRHSGAASAMEILQQALPYKDTIVAVGLDSTEVGYPPSQYQRVFDRAREEGFLTVAHAGEEGPPEYIWEAIDLLGVSRIDHGVRCVEDPKLVEYLAEKQIPLTVCPLSNVKLCVFEAMVNHNLKELLDMGLCITLNSDDPAYFGGYILENFQEARSALNLSQQDIVQIVKNSFRASFLSEEAKQVYIDRVDDFITRLNPLQPTRSLDISFS